MEYVSPIVSIIALVVSLFTAWFTILRRGSVRSTQPSLIVLKYEIGPGDAVPLAKVFLRSLLYSTGKRGHVVENLFLRVSDGSRSEVFSFWAYGERNELILGSGLSVPESGVAANHHFNPEHQDVLFRFSQGIYTLELVAKLIGQHKPISLWTTTLDVPAGPFSSSIARDTAIYFRWSLENQRYVAKVERRPGNLALDASSTG